MMNRDTGITVSLRRLNSGGFYHHQDVELLYLIDGTLDIHVGIEEYHMAPEDIIVVNSGKRFELRPQGECIICRVQISDALLKEYLSSSLYLFWCNSTLADNAEMNTLRGIMQELVNRHIETRGKPDFGQYSLYYRLLDCLTSHYLVENGEAPVENKPAMSDERVQKVVEYVQANYMRPITLNAIAQQMFLSHTYLSRLIKKVLGVNFINHLNSVRHYHATDELLHTDKSITHIAVNNGFSNITAFNKSFKQIYGITPSEYRKQMLAKSPGALADAELDEKGGRLQSLKSYLSEQGAASRQSMEQNTIFISESVLVFTPYKRPWRNVLNMGRGSDLLDSKMQAHILKLKRELKFTYVRFWSIFSAELDFEFEGAPINYSKLDEIIDFLLQNDLKPFIQLGQKPQQLMRSHGNTFLSRNTTGLLKLTEKEWEDMLDALMEHLVWRYGVEEVETWILELWRPNVWDEAVWKNWYTHERYMAVNRAVKRHVPKIRMGGSEYALTENYDDVLAMVDGNRSEGIEIDFVSFLWYPYHTEGRDENTPMPLSSDTDYFKKRLNELRSALGSEKYKNVQVFITEWSLTLSNRNTLNDSLYKGAWIIKNLIDSIDDADEVVYWVGSDRFSEHSDSSKILFGGAGLLSKDGICKPSLYALKFMNSLRKYLIYKDEHCVISTDSYGNYSIVCHNMRRLDRYAYIVEEEELSMENESKIFSDHAIKTVNIKLTGLTRGTYNVKISAVNKERGSVLDEWAKWGYISKVGKEQVEYLDRIATPAVELQKVHVDDGVLVVERSLEANEFIQMDIRKSSSKKE